MEYLEGQPLHRVAQALIAHNEHLSHAHLARIAADAARRERDSSDAVYASLTWSREAEKTGREAERRYRAFFDAVAPVLAAVTQRLGRTLGSV